MMDCNVVLVVICALSLLFFVFLTWKLLKYKKEVLVQNQTHEENMKEAEWRRKVEWEDRLTKKANDAEKLKSQLAGKDGDIGYLKSQLEKTTQLDVERVALLVHSFSGNTEPITSEKMKNMVKQLKETQNAIKEYLK